MKICGKYASVVGSNLSQHELRVHSTFVSVVLEPETLTFAILLSVLFTSLQ